MGKSIRYILHIAAALVLFGGLYSIFAKQKANILVDKESPAMHIGFPYALTLEDFSIDRYPSGEARNYSSSIHARSLDGKEADFTCSVNRPARLDGWRIYQTGYDTKAGDASGYSIVQCVKDPLYPVIAASLWAMIAGAFLLFLKNIPGKKKKGLWTLIAVLFIFFVYLTMDRVGIGSHDLRPALRSGWFVPHIVAYMFAYSIMATVTIYAIVLAARSGKKAVGPKDTAALARTVKLGWAFMTMGMCMGALWAKQSWGDWWTWDPKETWALFTWIAYGAFFHLAHRIKPKWSFSILFVSFLLLQMCWWGVNLLPSATSSLHTY